MKQITPLSRRQFLAKSAGLAGAGVLACGGLGVLSVQTPELRIVDTRAPGAGGTSKILVTYATRAGSTAEVAEKIGQVLNAHGAPVDVRPVKRVTDIDGYGAVIVGSAIRMGKWLPEAVDFVTRNKAPLGRRPNAFFTVHLSNTESDDASCKARQAYTEPVRQILTPGAEVFFAGRLDFSKLSWVDRTIMQMKQSPERDLCNWEAVRAWAEGLYPSL